MTSVFVAESLAGLPCPAAPLLAGELGRRGRPVEYASLTLGTPVVSGTIVPGAGGPVGLAIASADPADRHTLGDWLAVTGPRTILLAAPRSFCAGVERAIDTVRGTLDTAPGPVYVRRQIVHNRHVVAALEQAGATFVEELDEVPDHATVVFSAHGVAPSVRTEASRRGLPVVDATCPLVAKVHAEARRYAERGDTVVLIGHADHEEVEGTVGEAPAHIVTVATPAEVETLVIDDPSRVSYLTQTTLAMDESAAVVHALRKRFPLLRGPASADICYATTNRQEALQAIATDADIVLVVGSTNSSNSQRLVELATRTGTPAHLIDGPTDIRPAWLATARTIGLTAGASAPPSMVDAVVSALGGLGPTTVEERETTRETIRFRPAGAPA
ncbi:4-hydroxy-3-methylbut-2-enyl diphosphate reductase [Actinoplanes sp. NPDC051494]|uniref:4-hydroxy-3-methylbut-2-enyl diphosphate reductase n=1 Tax=Actinoplanes sp. NPDC051494 TaxID=3363907 RepID=UPI00378C34C9